MKRIILSLLLITRFISSYAYTVDQEEDTASTSSNTPADLILGYYDKDFHPFNKGAWMTKLSFSLSDKDLTNVARLFDQVEAGRDFSYNLNLSGGHFLNDYFMVGVGLGFNESKFTGSLINMDSDTINAESISRNIAASPFVRVVMPLTKNERLSFYNDFGMTFGYGRTLTRDTENVDEIEKKFSDQFVFGVGLSPGITYFAIENFALEAGVNLIGYRMNIEQATDGNGVETRKVEHDVNFKINLLTLNVGVSYFF